MRPLICRRRKAKQVDWRVALIATHEESGPNAQSAIAGRVASVYRAIRVIRAAVTLECQTSPVGGLRTTVVP
jgi:hypothetical protein